MRKYLVLPTLGACMLALGAAASPSLPRAVAPAAGVVAGNRADVPGGIWEKAEQVPGTAALNPGGAAEVRALSCGAPGNCSTGGNVATSTGTPPNSTAWIASENNGRWGHAREVATALNTGGNAEISSVSCPAAGNCGAGGSYANRSRHLQAFVISEVNDTWGRAQEAAGTLNTGGNAQIYTLSCGSAGNCAAGGYYRDNSGHYQAFIVTQKDGTWGTAREAAPALNTGGNAAIESVSCPSAGNCAAAGQYLDRGRHTQAFVINEVHGTWGQAAKVAAPTTDGSASIQSVSCATADNCSAGGSYRRIGSTHIEAFVVDERRGRWGTAEEVPGTAALNQGGNATTESVSCASAANCSAGGSYTDSSHNTQVFLASEAHGKWSTAEEVPGIAALNTGGFAQIGVSCPAAGNCSAGGSYADVPGHPFHHWQAFVVDEVHGRWGTAEEVPGTAALNKGGNAVVAALSCASASHCSAGGYYSQAPSKQETFVVNKR
jgi:hypothetical protein